jgi:prevent-host-death family protein
MPDETMVKQDSEVDEGESSEGVGIVRARDVLGDLVNRAGYANERIVITKHGKPAAALVSMGDLERLRALDAA